MEEKFLEELGLGKNEVRVYLALLKLGESRIKEISKESGVYRRTVYDALRGLREKGLASYIVRGKNKYYTASNPKFLSELLEQKQDKLNKILPKLSKLRKKEKQEVKAEIYRGKKALRGLIEEQVESGEFLGIGITDKAWNMLNFSIPHLLKKARKNKTKIRMLVHEEAKKIFQKIKDENIKIKSLPEKYYSPSSTLIWSDKVSISHYEKEPTIIVIENKDINKAYRNYFNLLWKQAEK